METELLIQSLRQECEQLKKENNYLKEQISLLLNHQRPTQSSSVESSIVTKHSPIESKIELFKSLFKGREDVYAIRWESKTGKSGYTPACAHEWQQPICLKPAIKCSDCQNRKLIPLTNKVIIDHLSGKQVVGLYPMNKDETCSFLVVDFDKKNWQQDVTAFIQVCKNLEMPYSIERSRSGNGAHVWFFFNKKIKASYARKLGSGLLSKTLEKRHEIGIESYDRMFPNQDTLIKGGFGNFMGFPCSDMLRKMEIVCLSMILSIHTLISGSIFRKLTG